VPPVVVVISTALFPLSTNIFGGAVVASAEFTAKVAAVLVALVNTESVTITRY
jgi:hypothetical protein